MSDDPCDVCNAQHKRRNPDGSISVRCDCPDSVTVQKALPQRIAERREKLRSVTETGGLWVCTSCGCKYDAGAGRPLSITDVWSHWRWAGEHWEHRCHGMSPQAGHSLAIPDIDVDGVPSTGQPLSVIVADDLLADEPPMTKEQRRKLMDSFLDDIDTVRGKITIISHGGDDGE